VKHTENQALIAQVQQRLETCGEFERSVLHARLTALVESLKPDIAPRSKREASQAFDLEEMFDNMPV